MFQQCVNRTPMMAAEGCLRGGEKSNLKMQECSMLSTVAPTDLGGTPPSNTLQP